MKKLLLFIFAAVTLASCQKSGNESPSSSTVSTENYAALNIKTSTQVVKVGVTANVLNLTYNEDVTLIADSGKMNSSWNLHLKEDFTGTKLADYNYKSMTKFGVDATNWVDDNLKNIIIRSSKDTLINNKLFVKKRITRTFNYNQTFTSAAEATNMQSQLLKTTDIIAFTSYFASVETADTHANTSNTAKLTYMKN